jgi:archaellum component FlaF (FlaF/FlaG flagellin family)
MGFSVTAAHVIFAIAILASMGAASAAYWKNQAHVEESRRAMLEREIEASRTNLTITGWQWNPGLQTLEFTITNKGTTVLDHTKFSYLIDGALTFASQSAGYPLLNGAAATSSLLLPGDELDCKYGLGSQPATLHVVAENGISVHYPG